MTKEQINKLQNHIDELGRFADMYKDNVRDEKIYARYIAEIDGMRNVLEMIGYTIRNRQIIEKA
jgi:uncharacterized protein (UPF0128 family)